MEERLPIDSVRTMHQQKRTDMHASAFYDPDSALSLEKYSSAVTLSDMEIFVFPEVLYALMLANIMSPLPWEWKNDPWFAGLAAMNPNRRLQRAKQFIMDNFTFNLDLDTWGLTNKPKELERFSQFISLDILAQSNALFGYEGDKYYFDIDIRRHFGLDKYTTEVIPYWKTETVEAMQAFRFKEGYTTGAGECVSLATLYASALWVLAGVPLKDIFLFATPLHSQNFIDMKEGFVTNNRRLVTKNMWFNGTELSAKARRALQNERITVVANNSGWIHVLYDEATIAPEEYERFSKKLSSYLVTDITFELLASFLRQESKLQKCFQIRHTVGGRARYIEIEKVFHYEHSSKCRVGEASQDALLGEIDEDEYYPEPLSNRLLINEFEAFFRGKPLPPDSKATAEALKSRLCNQCMDVDVVIDQLFAFCKMHPRLPAAERNRLSYPVIELDGMTGPEQVIEYLEGLRGIHPIADLAFMAFRDMSRAPWKPFMKAALERNPVSIDKAKDLDLAGAYAALCAMAPESIYPGPLRIAQPDEVWNYARGDGLEKAICLMNIAKAKDASSAISLSKNASSVVVSVNGAEFVFESGKTVDAPVASDWEF